MEVFAYPVFESAEDPSDGAHSSHLALIFTGRTLTSSVEGGVLAMMERGTFQRTPWGWGRSLNGDGVTHNGRYASGARSVVYDDSCYTYK